MVDMDPLIGKFKATMLIMYDPDELVDILCISSEEILDRFEDKFTEELIEEYTGQERPYLYLVDDEDEYEEEMER